MLVDVAIVIITVCPMTQNQPKIDPKISSKTRQATVNEGRLL